MRYSADTRPHTGPKSRPILDRHLGRQLWVDTPPTLSAYISVEMSVDISADTRPTLSADTQPISRPIFDRHLGRHSRKITTNTWSSVGRHVLQVGTPSVTSTLRHYTTLQHLADTRPTVSADTRSTRSLGRHLTDTRLTLDPHSTDTRPTLDRHLGRYSTGISADTRPTLRFLCTGSNEKTEKHSVLYPDSIAIMFAPVSPDSKA